MTHSIILRTPSTLGENGYGYPRNRYVVKGGATYY